MLIYGLHQQLTALNATDNRFQPSHLLWGGSVHLYKPVGKSAGRMSIIAQTT